MRFILILLNLILFTFYFLIFAVPDVKASFYLEQGAYLENNQWGALDDILNDWKTRKINTDECALYGCYVLAINEPSRSDGQEKIKKLPLKYKLVKKSLEKGPYFFIHFLYKHESELGKKAIDEFRLSDWCYDEFLDDIFCNNKLKDEFEKFFLLPKNERYKITSLTRGHQYYFFAILEYFSRFGVVKPESVYIAAMVEFYDNYNKFYKRYKIFVGNYPVSTYGDFYFSAIKIIAKIKNTKNRKVINILNYYYFLSSQAGNWDDYYK